MAPSPSSFSTPHLFPLFLLVFFQLFSVHFKIYSSISSLYCSLHGLSLFLTHIILLALYLNINPNPIFLLLFKLSFSSSLFLDFSYRHLISLSLVVSLLPQSCGKSNLFHWRQYPLELTNTLWCLFLFLSFLCVSSIPCSSPSLLINLSRHWNECLRTARFHLVSLSPLLCAPPPPSMREWLRKISKDSLQ